MVRVVPDVQPRGHHVKPFSTSSQLAESNSMLLPARRRSGDGSCVLLARAFVAPDLVGLVETGEGEADALLAVGESWRCTPLTYGCEMIAHRVHESHQL